MLGWAQRLPRVTLDLPPDALRVARAWDHASSARAVSPGSGGGVLGVDSESPAGEARPTSMKSIALALVTTLLCAGCGEGLAPCPAGSVYDLARGRCVADPGDVGVRDVGVGDLGVDADLPDAGQVDLGRGDGGALPDAGAVDHGAPDASAVCDGECAGAAPVCEPLTETCVECVLDEHCPSSEPRCNTAHACVECLSNVDCPGAICDASTARCVECLSNAHCGHLASSRCDPATLACSPCLSDADCGQIPGRPACVAGQCGPCHPTMGDYCGSYSCSQETFECTDTVVSSLDLYNECEADSECEGWASCVLQSFVGPDRYVCTRKLRHMDCMRPGYVGFPAEQHRLTIHGQFLDLCAIRENWLTYDAAQVFVHYWWFGTEIATPDMAGYRCERSSDCPFGTYCRPMHFPDQPAPTNHCTITGCTGDVECPRSMSCRSGDPGQPDYCAVWDP